MTFLNENPVVEKFWGLYGATFASLYLYCARRATTKPVIAFIMKSLYENAFDEMKHDQEITLLDLYKWAYEFFSIQSSDTAYKMSDLHDVYDVKTSSGSRSIRREETLRNFYSQLAYKEREVLWLTFFEGLSVVDRAVVMGMREEECTKLYYDALKKAKDVVSMTSSSQKSPVFSRFTSYFGGVASLLKKAREHEGIEVDQEILTSLRELFMEQFARASAQNFYQPVGQTDNVPAQASTVTSGPTSYAPPAPARAQTITQEQADDEFLDDDFGDESLGRVLLRKLQGVAVVAVIVVVALTGYFKFFSEDARVDRLLADSRVQFGSDFSQEQKESFAREALLYLAKGRDYSAVKIDRKDKILIQVSFDLDGDGKESFVVYRDVQSFDYDFVWQPREYVRLVAV